MAKTKRITVTVKTKTYDELAKYSANVNRSRSDIADEFIQEGLKLKSTKDNIDFVTNEIDRCLEVKLKRFEDRLCRILAKDTKGNLANLYLLSEVLHYLYGKDDDTRTWLKNKLEVANKKAYQVLKSGYLERDINILFDKKDEEL